jgi:hypothetical protein
LSVDVTTAPLYLHARSGSSYDAQALRQPLSDIMSPGVASAASFALAQRSAGANMSIDVGSPSVVNVAYVRGSDVADQGLYRIAYSGSVLNIAIGANASGNPRIDRVILRIGDSAHAGALDKAYLDVVAGSPTVGATLANQLGVASEPANALTLGFVLVANGAASIVTASIQDTRRRFAVGGSGTSGTTDPYGTGSASLSSQGAIGGIPTGAFIPYGPLASGGSVPPGFLQCNGASVSRRVYADLFAVIGVIYGAGDGSTTFALPGMSSTATSPPTPYIIKT